MILTLMKPLSVQAEDKHTESSAKLKPESVAIGKIDNRPGKLKTFLTKYNSPLAEYEQYIVTVSDAYNLPWSIITAISGVESTFCQHIPSESYNCWGWNNGNYRFLDYEDALYTVAKTLRFNYFDKGLLNPYLINPVYAPPSKVWGEKVARFMSEIENTPANELPLNAF